MVDDVIWAVPAAFNWLPQKRSLNRAELEASTAPGMIM